ncbi:MAG: energy-coupled thiamine transporter ThiT [Clostridia bacterium]|nr:energy-coupled thiamine transporter ThiT [Clostridia bacterium]
MFLTSLLSSFFTYYEDLEGNEGYVYENVWTEYAEETLGKVFLWLVIVAAVLLVAVGIFIRFKKQEALAAYVKTALTASFGLGLAIGVTMITLEITKTFEKGYLDWAEGMLGLVLVPVCVVCGLLVLGIIATYVASFFDKKTFKITAIASLSAVGAAFVALLICLIVYYASGNAEYNNGAEISTSGNVILYISAILIIAVIIAGAFIFDKGTKGFDTKSISYAAVCIALSFALSYIKMWEMPYGGSITLASLLPLMIYSYMFGTKKGVMAGFIYGILQALQDPWLIHPAQFLLDYPIAFSAIGLAGMFAHVKALDKLPQVKFALGAIVACALRYVSHVFSGVFAFGTYAASYGYDSAWVYSLAYNSFVFVDVAIVIVVGIIVFSSKAFIKQISRYSSQTEKTEKTETSDAE